MAKLGRRSTHAPAPTSTSTFWGERREERLFSAAAQPAPGRGEADTFRLFPGLGWIRPRAGPFAALPTLLTSPPKALPVALLAPTSIRLDYDNRTRGVPGGGPRPPPAGGDTSHAAFPSRRQPLHRLRRRPSPQARRHQNISSPPDILPRGDISAARELAPLSRGPCATAIADLEASDVP